MIREIAMDTVNSDLSSWEHREPWDGVKYETA